MGSGHNKHSPQWIIWSGMLWAHQLMRRTLSPSINTAENSGTAPLTLAWHEDSDAWSAEQHLQAIVTTFWFKCNWIPKLFNHLNWMKQWIVVKFQHKWPALCFHMVKVWLYVINFIKNLENLDTFMISLFVSCSFFYL